MLPKYSSSSVLIPPCKSRNLVADRPNDSFGVQNDPTCTNIGFSISALSSGIWRKGETRFSCSHLAVDISLWQARCFAEQLPKSIGG